MKIVISQGSSQEWGKEAGRSKRPSKDTMSSWRESGLSLREFWRQTRYLRSYSQGHWAGAACGGSGK